MTVEIGKVKTDLRTQIVGGKRRGVGAGARPADRIVRELPWRASAGQPAERGVELHGQPFHQVLPSVKW